MTEEGAACTVQAKREKESGIFGATLFVAVTLAILATSLNVLYLIMHGYQLSFFGAQRFIRHFPWYAGFSEEFSLDIFGPLLFVYLATHNHKGRKLFRCSRINKIFPIMGIETGIVFGILELYEKVANRSHFTLVAWQSPAFNIGMVPPVFLHIMNGFIGWTIIGVLASEGALTRRDYVLIFFTWIILATFHGYIWNTYLSHNSTQIMHALGF